MPDQEANPNDLRDIHGFQAVEIPTWFWILIGLIILGIICWLLYKYVFKPKPQIPLSLFEKTTKLLKELNLNETSKNFYLNYSEIVRIYLEERLKVALLDKTAEEIKPILTADSRINTQTAMSLAQIFNRADLAKFAKYELSKEQKEDDINQTISVLTGIEDFVRFEEERLKTITEGELIK